MKHSKIITRGVSGLLIVSLAIFFLCKKKTEPGSTQTTGVTAMKIEQKLFGKTPEGQTVTLYTLTNSKGMKAEITNYGGIVVSLSVPDRNGNVNDIVLGYETLDGYIKSSSYFGAIVGRYGNRIAKGKFALDGKTYQLATNNGKNHLHGGQKGFDKVVWDAEPVTQDSTIGVKLIYVSRDGEEGYPGNLTCTVTYLLTENNELKVLYTATTDKATPINLTHHSYFNLEGQGNGDILTHELMLNADKFTPVDSELIPTGEIKPVKGTPWDFTIPKQIGKELAQVTGGYDHNFVINNYDKSLQLAARVYEPTTGRVMEIYTTEPGIQFYSGNFLDGTIIGKKGKVYQKHYGFCLETQHFPDSPNNPNFPSTILRPGELYSQVTVHRFYTK